MQSGSAGEGRKLRWGILGTGNIARQFAVGVATSRRGVLAAVGSRSRESADSFSRQFGIPQAFGRYEDVLEEREVNAVYVSLPNHLHHDWTVAALRAGKHVLCEKPIASNAAEAEAMCAAAERAGRVLMEAFMYRSHPQTLAVLDALRGGAIGKLRLIRTSFCYRTTRIADNIRFRQEMAGGSLMDVGCYCVSFARLFAGEEPTEVHATGHFHETGVDDLAAGTLRFPGGVVASFTCGTTVQADNTAYLCGTEGFIEIPVPWKPPAENATFSIVRAAPPRMDGPPKVSAPPRQTHAVTAGANLYGLEADDFAAAVLDGTPPRVSRTDTLGNMRVLDELRRLVGVSV